MQVVLNSNAASLVSQTITDGEVVSLAYASKPNYPVLSKSSNMVSPQLSFPASPDNQSHTFMIPRGGYHYNAMLKFTYTGIMTSDEVTGFNMMNMIRNIKFLCNGQPILNMDGEAYKAIVMNSSASIQEFVYRYSKVINPANDLPRVGAIASVDTQSVSYLPLFASWYQEIEKALNTSELTQLSLVVSYKDFASAGLIDSLSTLNAEFQNFLYVPNLVTDREMVKTDFTSPIIMQSFNTVVEQVAVTTYATPTKIISQVPNLVYKTHVFVAKTNTTSGAVLGCPFTNVKSVSVYLGGQPAIYNYSRASINYEQALRGMANHTISNDTSLTVNAAVQFNRNNIFTIDWSLGCHRDSATGYVSFNNLGPRFEVTIDEPAANPLDGYVLFLVHEYWNVLQVDAGRNLILAAST